MSYFIILNQMQSIVENVSFLSQDLYEIGVVRWKTFHVLTMFGT